MKFRFMALAVAALAVAFSPALAANNYDVIDAHGATRTMAARDSGGILHGQHLVEGLSSGVPTPTNMTTPGALDVNVVAGGAGGGAVTAALNSYVDGYSVTLGALGDPVWAGSGSGTAQAIAKYTAQKVEATRALLAGTLTVSGTVIIGGTLPAFATTPTFNLGTIGAAATAANQATANGSLATIATNTGSNATAANQASIIGSKAAGVAAANSLLTGGVFNTTLPTLTNGQQAGTQLGARGQALATLVDAAGAALDPNAGSAVLCGATVGAAVQCATAAKQPTLDTAGAAIVPQAAAAQRTLTATNLTLNTNTTVCPAATNPVSTEIYFTTAGVGVGLNGQTLTAATPGATTTNSPDFAINTAGTLYTAPVGVSNAITAYGAAGVVRCVQTLRQ